MNLRSMLAGILLLAAVALAAEACYRLTLTTFHPPGPGGVPSVIPPRKDDWRKGEALTPAEKKGVQAAVDMLKRWEDNCGVGPDTPTGGTPGPKPSARLQTMLDAGQICREVAADPKNTGATTSNPITGNGVQNPPGTQAGGGSTWTTEGHPGTNIQGGQIPKVDPNGTFTSGGDTYDATSVANAAGQRLHETSHLSNPNNNANSAGDYEATAYTYAATELCKVAGCTSEPESVRRAVCKLIVDANKELCKYGKPQVQCDSCANLQPPINVIVPCPPTPPGGGGGGSGLLAYQAALAASSLPPVLALPQIQTELLAQGSVRGTAALDLATQQFSLRASSEQVNFDYVVDLGPTSGLNFVPMCFTQNTRGSAIVAGFDATSFTGKLVKLQYNVLTGVALAPAVIYSGTAFSRPTCIDVIPSVPRLVVMDGGVPQVMLLDLESGFTKVVATASTYPVLQGCIYVTAHAYVDEISSQNIGLVLTASSVSEADQGIGSSVSLFQMFDLDGDGTFDEFL